MENQETAAAPQMPPQASPVVTTPPPSPRKNHILLFSIVGATLFLLLLGGVFATIALKGKFVLPTLPQPLSTEEKSASKKIVFTWVSLNQATSSMYALDEASGVSYVDGDKITHIADADAATLEVLSYTGKDATTTTYTNYARDNAHAYYKERQITGADPATFEILLYENKEGDYKYAKDKTHAYFGETPIIGADPETFVALYHIESQYGAGEESYYEDYDTVYYAKDKNYVYGNSKILPSVDPTTVSLEGSFIKDSKAVFGTYAKVDAATFVSLGEEFYKDKDNYYCYGVVPLRVRDPATFKSLEHNFAQDSQAIYSASFCGALPNSDPASFEVIEGYDGKYAKDAHNVYINGTLAEGLDAATFSPVNKYYLKDAEHVYYNSGYGTPQIVKEAFSTDFSVFGPDSLYARGHTKVFYRGLVVKDARVISFVLLNDSYAKDQYNVYYKGTVIKDADPITFVASSTNAYAGHDKKGDYLYGRVVSTEESASLLVVEYIKKVRAQGYSDAAIRQQLQKDGLDTKTIDQLFAAAGPSSTSAGAANTQVSADASEYIRNSRMEGYSDSQIKTALLTAGWSESGINQAFAVTPKPTPIVDNNGNASVFYKDNMYVYCGGTVNNPSNLTQNGLTLLSVLKGADVKTFTLITDSSGAATPFGKDTNSVFQRYTKGCEASATAFSSSGYFQLTPEAATFKYIGGTDKNNTYYRDQTRLYNWGGLFLSPVYAVLGPIDLASFEVFTSVQVASSTKYDAQDKYHKYYKGRQLK